MMRMDAAMLERRRSPALRALITEKVPPFNDGAPVEEEQEGEGKESSNVSTAGRNARRFPSREAPAAVASRG